MTPEATTLTGPQREPPERDCILPRCPTCDGVIITREVRLCVCESPSIWLRKESRLCNTANGAIVLQAVAAWLDGYQLFDTPEKLWQTADRLCSPPTHEEDKP